MNPGEWASALTWRDGLDFALIFLLVYGLLRLVRGTRAVPLLAAVAVLWLVGWAVEALDLIASARILESFFASVIILLIVVFQQELRRLLLNIGQQVVPRSRREAAQSAVEALASGLDRMQRARIGALVILQGELPVMEIATGKGVAVDAPLHVGTLVALAIPHAANTVHDGAILIDEFRISRAGVICPLSEQTFDPRFGTRHRGAVGCTEETDALALVLSEERGELRIVENGVISEPVKVSEVESRIARWLSKPKRTLFGRRGEAPQSGTNRTDLNDVAVEPIPGPKGA